MIQLLVAFYANAGEAQSALARLKSKHIATVDTVILSKDGEGVIHVNDIDDPDARQGAVFGAIVGGLLGLLAGPVGGIVGAVAGATAGGVAAGAIDSGINNQQLLEITNQMQINTSALVTMLFAREVSTAYEALQAPNARILHYNVKMELDEGESELV